MRIEIIKKNDNLSRNVYTFMLLNDSLILDIYTEESRESTKHKFKPIKMYNRLDKRFNYIPISEDQIEITDEITNGVFDKLRSYLKICKWSEYKKNR